GERDHVLAPHPGTGHRRMVWCLTRAWRVGESGGTAPTGRRAVERPPQPGFHWRRGLALSVVDVTGHLATPCRWGTRVLKRRLAHMTKDASFKKVVRRHAAETGQRYTEAMTDLEGLEARMF